MKKTIPFKKINVIKKDQLKAVRGGTIQEEQSGMFKIIHEIFIVPIKFLKP